MAEITSAGYVPRTEVEIRDRIRARAETRFGASINWANVGVLGEVVDIAASEVADISNAVQALVDAWTLSNATGMWLASFGQLRGLYPSPGSASSANVDITAWSRSSVTLPAGYRMVAVGDGEAAAGDVWVLDADVTIAAGATETVAVASKERGRYVLGSGDTLKGAPTAGVTGVASIVYADSWAAGVPADTDDMFRQRLLSKPQSGSHSPNAIQTQLESLDGVTFAHVIANTGVGYLYEGGIAIPPGGAAVIVHPATAVTATREAIANVLRDNLVAGSSYKGPATTGDTGVVLTTTGADGQDVSYGWYWSTPKTQNVTVTLSNYWTGYALADVQDGVEAAITEYFESLRIGDPYTKLGLYGKLSAVPGFKSATISGDDVVTCEPYEYFTEGTVVVS